MALWASASRTHPGHLRAVNEDAVLEKPEVGLWAVADGLGGHQHGAFASRLAIDSLAGLSLDGSLAERLATVELCLQTVNRKLVSAPTVRAGLSRPIIGTTIVVLVATAGQAACLWVGDSRCYLWRERQLFQLSRDHSVITAEVGLPSPGLTRALGGAKQLETESVALSVHPGDALLLCSDGLYQETSPAALARAMSMPLATLAIDQLFEQALKGRAPDNLSGVIVRV